jgi:uncharacterized membrane protein
MSQDAATPTDPAPTAATESTESTDDARLAGETFTDGARALFVADYPDPDLAWEAYEAIKAKEGGRHLDIDGVVVVRRDADGSFEVQKATDHSTRTGLTWGLVGGAVLGILFPPSILGSAVVLGGAGAAIGKARQLHHRHELAEELGDGIEPGHSGIVALVSDPAALEVREALEKADRIDEKALDKAAADDITAAAKEAKQEAKAQRKAAKAAAKAERKAAKAAAKAEKEAAGAAAPALPA